MPSKKIEIDFWDGITNRRVDSPSQAPRNRTSREEVNVAATFAMKALQPYPLPQPDGSLVGITKADLTNQTGAYAVSQLLHLAKGSVVSRGSGSEEQFGWYNSLPRREQVSVKAGISEWHLVT